MFLVHGRVYDEYECGGDMEANHVSQVRGPHLFVHVGVVDHIKTKETL
jgi:hypothetical protein